MDEPVKIVSQLAYYPNIFLLKRTELVVDFAPIPAIAEMMFDTMLLNYGIGLAANQCKLNLRVFVMRTTNLRQAFVNAKILEAHGTVLYKERCLSFPGIEIEKKRAQKVIVAFQDINGVELVTTLENLESIVAQHEIEHLDGKTFVDDLSQLKRKMLCQQVQKHLKPRKNK